MGMRFDKVYLGSLAQWCLCVLLVCAGRLSAEVRVIGEEGDEDRLIRIVFVAEGFVEERREAFFEAVGKAREHLFSEQPFSDYESYFTAKAVFAPSAEAGADIPSEDIEVDTLLDATFGTNGLSRALTVSLDKLGRVLSEEGAGFDLIVVLVDSDKHGGAGSPFIAISSMADNYMEIVAHEFGHAFAFLADEYSYEGGGGPHEAANVTAKTEREQIKWRLWIEEETPLPTPEDEGYNGKVGLFEGAGYSPEGWYRPNYNSKMRSLSRPWGAVNGEAIVGSIYRMSDFFEGVYPEVDTVRVYEDAFLEFRIEEALPESEDGIYYVWTLNGSVSLGEGTRLTLDTRLLEDGWNELELLAEDRTAFVRSEEAKKFLEQRQTWAVLKAESYEQWSAVVFEGVLSGKSWADDPDLDGRSNLEEFFDGTDPLEMDPVSSGRFSWGFEAGKLFYDIEKTDTSRFPDVAGVVESFWGVEPWFPIVRVWGDQVSLIGPGIIEELEGGVVRIWDDGTRVRSPLGFEIGEIPDFPSEEEEVLDRFLRIRYEGVSE